MSLEQAARDVLKAVRESRINWEDHPELVGAFVEMDHEIEYPSKRKPVGEVTNSGQSAVFYANTALEDGDLLYTQPPRREWVSITKERADEILKNTPVITGTHTINFKKFVQAINDELKELNT